METAKLFINKDALQIKELPDKGRAFVATQHIERGLLLLEESAFEAWPHGHFSETNATAALVFRARNSINASSVLQYLFPIQISMIPTARREQVPQSEIDEIAEKVADMEAGAAIKQPQPPSRDFILRFYFVLQCNSFPTALLATMSNANHSCNPNARVDEVEGFPSPMYQLTAKRDIQCGEEVTISYIDLVANVELAEDRQRYLEEHFLFYCQCEWCHAPQPTTGLLAGSNTIIHGPLHEDYTCAVFQWTSENESSAEMICESGNVGKLTGRCKTCGKTATQKQLDNICRKSDRLILSLRRMLVETNAFVEAVRAGGNSASNTPSNARSRQSTTESAKSFTTTSTMKEEGVKNAATLKELKRLQSLMKGMETRAIELLHSSHIAFVPIRACLDDLQELIGAGSSNGTKIRKKERKAEDGEGTDANDNDTIEVLVRGVENLLN